MNEQELTTDKEYLNGLYDGLYDLIEFCLEAKGAIKDIENWKVVHNLEFQLCLSFEILKRYVDKED